MAEAPSDSGKNEPKPKHAHGKHPNSLANLKPPWKKGQSGNPEGKQPVGPVFTPVLRRYANMRIADFFRLALHDATVGEVIAAGMAFEALQSGNDKARTEIINRLDGVQKPSIELNDNRTQILIKAFEGGDIELIS